MTTMIERVAKAIATSIYDTTVGCVSPIKSDEARNKYTEREWRQYVSEARAAIEAYESAAVQEPVAVKALEWSDPAEPNEICRYNHVIAKAVFVYSIEWKAWKKYDALTAYRDGEFLDSLPTLDEAKAAAQADYEQRIRSALSTSPSDPAPEMAALRGE